MKSINTNFSTLILWVAVCALAASPVWGQCESAPGQLLSNCGFEDDALVDGDFLFAASSWTQTGSAGVINLTDAQMPGGAAGGENVAWINSGFFCQQIVASMNAGESYLMQAEIGLRADVGTEPQDWILYLSRASDGAARCNASPVLSAGAFTNTSCTFTADGSDAGNALEACFWVLNGQINPDEVVAARSVDLFLLQSGPSLLAPGSALTYTVTASNFSGTSVTGAEVSSTLPAAITGAGWTCAGSGGAVCNTGGGSGNAVLENVDLPNNSSVTLTLTGSVDPGFTGTLANTATVTTPTHFELTPADNSATTTTVVQAGAPRACNPGVDGPNFAASGILNSYYPATADGSAGSFSLTLGGQNGGAANALNPGDQILILQVQDATIDSSNTDAYGDGVAGGAASGVTDLGSTGLYEFACVASGTSTAGGTITLDAPLVNNYRASGASTFQVIRVPQYEEMFLSGTIQSTSWDGTSGGVVVLDVRTTLDLGSQAVDVSSRGFRRGVTDPLPSAFGDVLDYRSTDPLQGAPKGEGIAGFPSNYGGGGYPGGDFARGAPGNAGGGGNAHNAGGGGGGSCGTGGQGGDPNFGAAGTGGFGGAPVPAANGRLFFGGGGGAGEQNNGSITQGAPGGGIVMLFATQLIGSGTVSADGGDALDLVGAGEGVGGGGGGGAVLIAAGGDLSFVTTSARGGDGADLNQGFHGPGGGGGGGLILTSSNPAFTFVDGGANGLAGGAVFGAAQGYAGGAGTFASPPTCGTGPPVFSKNFSPDAIFPGQTTTLTYTINNTARPGASTGLNFTDTLPVDIAVVNPPNLSSDCGGSVGVAPGSNLISLNFGAVSAGASCTISVDVTGSVLGSHEGISGLLQSAEGPVGTATATLNIGSTVPPTFTKAFAPTSVTLGGISTLSLMIDNTANAGDPANALSVIDSFPAGMVVASPANASSDCGGTLTAAAGATSISLAGGSVAAGGLCTVSVDVVAQNPGALLNVTDPLSTSLGLAAAASATLTVADEVAITLTVAESGDPVAAGGSLSYTVTVGNTGPSEATQLDLAQVLTLPPGVTVNSITPSAGTGYAPPDAASGTWQVPSLAAGASATLTLALDVGAGASPGVDVITTVLTLSAVDQPNVGATGVAESTSISDTVGLAVAAEMPVLSGETIDVPIVLTTDPGVLASTAFSIDYDEACLGFDPTDTSPADGIPDSISIPYTAPDFGVLAVVDLGDSDGEIDILLFSTNPSATLSAGPVATVTFTADCDAEATMPIVAPIAFSADPAVSFGDANAQVVSGTASDGSVEIFDGIRGDCNADEALGAPDITAAQLEIFDADGSAWTDTLDAVPYLGSPVGCDANADTLVDAGDLTCEVNLIFGQTCGAPFQSFSAADSSPRLEIAGELPVNGGGVTVQVAFDPGDASGTSTIGSLVFSLDYDERLLVFDDLPGAVRFLGTPVALRSLRFNADDTAGELDIVLVDLTSNLAIEEGILLEVDLRVLDPNAGSIDRGIAFSTSPRASFGDLDGRGVPGTATWTGPGPIFIDGFESGDTAAWGRND